MKNILKLLSISLFIVLIIPQFIACEKIKTDPGNVTVQIKKPLFGGEGGVRETPLNPGTKYQGAWHSYAQFPTTPIKLEEEFSDIITKDNNPIDFKAYFIYEYIPQKTPILFQNFGLNWYANNVEEEFRKRIRDYCSRYKMFTLTTDRTIVTKLQERIKNEMITYINHIGIPIKVNDVIIGRVIPPKAVIDETIKTAAQIQRKKTLIAEKLAEDERALVEKAKAKADNAYRQELGYSTSQYLEHQRIQNEKMLIESGKGNINYILNSGATPTIPLR